MEFTLTVNVDGAAHRFGVLADSLKDLSPVLKEFDKYKRAKIDELFATEGNGKWPARSEAAESRGWQQAIERAHAAPQVLVKKLKRELFRATKRRDKVFGATSATELTHANRRRSAENTVARRAFVLAAFEKAVGAGDLNVGSFTDEDRRLQKSVRGLEARLGRAYGRANRSGRIMAGVARTIESKIQNGRLVIDSNWNSPAPAALQHGGTTGHGAKLPPRPFLFWDDADVEYLAILFKERAMLAWRS